MMNFFDLASIILVIAALFAFINLKTFRLPTTIGVMVMALIASTLLILLHYFGFNYDLQAKNILSSINFESTLMDGMLSFLLFAGALHVNLHDLKKQFLPVALLASFGVVISTFFIGYASFLLLGAFGVEVGFIHCLLFGALISPTDPIAVMSLLKEAQAPPALETKIAGESLFNDGVGVVIFTMILGLITNKTDLSFQSVTGLFVHEALGGAGFGLIFGYISYLGLKAIDNYKVEVIITLALVMGGYSLASHYHLSAPIAMVIAGLLIGNQGKTYAMSDTTREYLGLFWELIDEILNISLFVLIGLEIIVIAYTTDIFLMSLLIIPVVLMGRLIGVFVPFSFLKRFQSYIHGVVPIMTWGGVRGGISVALALSMPEMPGRDIFIGITYSVVIFSVLVQGLSFKRVLVFYLGRGEKTTP